MSALKYLVEFDISNNLFIDAKTVAKSLKTLPYLTHLIYSFKDEKE